MQEDAHKLEPNTKERYAIIWMSWKVYIPLHELHHYQLVHQKSVHKLWKKMCYIYNIFTINYRWLVVISYNLNLPLKLFFYLTNDNL